MAAMGSRTRRSGRPRIPHSACDEAAGMALLRVSMGVHEFEIPVADLDAAGKDFRFPVRAAWLRGVLEGTDIRSGETDGEVNVRVSKSGTDVVVHGSLRADLVTSCARCMNDAKVSVEGPLAVLMVPAKKMMARVPGPAAKVEAKTPRSADKVANKTDKKADKSDKGRGGKRRTEEDDELSFSPEEADVAPYDGDTVVLDDVVKDEILLEIPMIPLCSEDCPGISPPAVEASGSAAKEASEEDLIDSRLLPLLELKKIQLKKPS